MSHNKNYEQDQTDVVRKELAGVPLNEHFKATCDNDEDSEDQAVPR